MVIVLQPTGHIYTSSGEDVFQTIDEWNNDMAKDMMSLEQELEAFGEKMPDKHEKGSTSRKTEVTNPTDWGTVKLRNWRKKTSSDTKQELCQSRYMECSQWR